MKLLATARFSDTVVKLDKLLESNPDGLPEVAFVGRSNAGKSSCINLICNRRRLAFSSRTPGRTQSLNLFAVGAPGPSGPDGEDSAPPVGYLVDTPGYGFAAAPPSAKRSWQALAGDYIRQRGPLAGVVLMVDIRRELTDLDRQLLGWTPPDVAPGDRHDQVRQVASPAGAPGDAPGGRTTPCLPGGRRVCWSCCSPP